MLLILTVLAVFLENTYGIDFRDCMGCIMPPRRQRIVLAGDPNVNSPFVRLNNRWKSNVVWDEKLAKKALKAAKRSDTGRAVFVVLTIKRFEEFVRNDTTLAQKVEGALRKKFRKLHALPVFSHYGCNGIHDMGDDQDVLTVACLYKAKIRKRE